MDILLKIISEWKFILTSVISIGGFIITICNLRKQIRAVKEEKVTELQRKIYLEVYNHIDKIINDNCLIYDKDYIMKLFYYKGEMKLVASKNTLNKYKIIFEKITKIYSDYIIYYDENDPAKYMVEISIDNESGEYYEVQHYTKQDMDDFNDILEIYRRKNILDSNTTNNLLSDLVDSMRKDLNID